MDIVTNAWRAETAKRNAMQDRHACAVASLDTTDAGALRRGRGPPMSSYLLTLIAYSPVPKLRL